MPLPSLFLPHVQADSSLLLLPRQRQHLDKRDGHHDAHSDPVNQRVGVGADADENIHSTILLLPQTHRTFSGCYKPLHPHSRVDRFEGRTTIFLMTRLGVGRGYGRRLPCALWLRCVPIPVAIPVAVPVPTPGGTPCRRTLRSSFSSASFPVPTPRPPPVAGYTNSYPGRSRQTSSALLLRCLPILGRHLSSSSSPCFSPSPYLLQIPASRHSRQKTSTAILISIQIGRCRWLAQTSAFS